MRKPILALITVAMLAIGSLAFAQPGPGGPGGPGAGGPGQPGMLPPASGLVEYLGLDAAQLEAWTAYHEEARATFDAFHETMKDLQTQLREALEADTPDAATIGMLVLDIEAVRDQILAAQQQLEANLKSLLTAEQLARYDAFRAAEAFIRNGKGPGGPGGPGGPPKH